MLEWVEVADGIVRFGELYSTSNFDPTPEDIERILNIAKKSGAIGIVRHGKDTLVFKDGEFLKNGEYIKTPLHPPFASITECRIIDRMSCGKKYDIDTMLKIVNELCGNERLLNKMVEEHYLEKVDGKYTLLWGCDNRR